MTIRPFLWPKWLSHTPTYKIAFIGGYSDPVYFTPLVS